MYDIGYKTRYPPNHLSPNRVICSIALLSLYMIRNGLMNDYLIKNDFVVGYALEKYFYAKIG